MTRATARFPTTGRPSASFGTVPSRAGGYLMATRAGPKCADPTQLVAAAAAAQKRTETQRDGGMSWPLTSCHPLLYSNARYLTVR